ncbi:MAG: thioredoxin [Candidatus Pacebacteria bacterium]|nr:thioredoxin [Candidatus Paceibacterota bacterium]
MLELNDQNFEKEIKEAKIPVLVDFFAEWCGPCSVLRPILENIAKDFEGRLILAKVDLDQAPQTAQKFQVNLVPTVVIFKEGEPVSGFVGLKSEDMIRDWINNTLGNSEADNLIKEYEEYARKNGFKLNPDKEALKRLIGGLLSNEKKYGKKYCPCRRVSGNEEEDRSKICPCRWHLEELDKEGRCACGLFLK